VVREAIDEEEIQFLRVTYPIDCVSNLSHSQNGQDTDLNSVTDCPLRMIFLIQSRYLVRTCRCELVVLACPMEVLPFRRGENCRILQSGTSLPKVMRSLHLVCQTALVMAMSPGLTASQ
jgi:hypothetical protein